MLLMKKKSTITNFGTKLAEARRRQGLSQRALAKLVGVSGRMIAYYESESSNPPAHLLEPLCHALKTSADELLGLKVHKQEISRQDWLLWKRFKKAEKLSTRDKKALFHFLNALLVKSQTHDKNGIS
jgi:transcriptional regulator with XRE-family HTH domain